MTSSKWLIFLNIIHKHIQIVFGKIKNGQFERFQPIAEQLIDQPIYWPVNPLVRWDMILIRGPL